METEIDVYTACHWCGGGIAYGNARVTMNRQVEQVGRSDEHPDGEVIVIDSEELLGLCAGCENRLDTGALSEKLEELEPRPKPRETVLDTLKRFCERNEIAYAERTEMSGLSFTVVGENGRWSCLATRIDDRSFGFYAYAPLNVPSAKRGAMGEYLARANYGLRTGAFEMDFADGEVRFRTSGFVPPGVPRLGIIDTVFSANMSIMDRYLPGILEVVFSEGTPEEIVAAIERKHEPADCD
jgi:hypothetical protein